MLTKKHRTSKSSEITDERVYLNRRLFIRGAVLAGSVAATGFIYRKLNPPPAVVEEQPKIAGLVTPPSDEAVAKGFKVTEAANVLRRHHQLQQLLRVFDRKAVGRHEARGFHHATLDVSKSVVWSISRKSLIWTILLKFRRRKNASIAIAVSKAGRWSFRGLDFRWSLC